MTNPSDTTTAAASVAIIDDDQILCDLLEGRIHDEPGLVCVGSAVTPGDARALVHRHQPRVILLDIRMGSGVDTLRLAAELAGLSPSSHVLVWTAWVDPSADRREELRLKVLATRAGATDWIAKGDGVENLIYRIRAAVGRGPMVRVGVAALSPLEESVGSILGAPVDLDDDGRRDGDGDLTPAERRAAASAALGLESGMKVEAIAKALRMKTDTLRTHLRSIYAKWGVGNQAQFVAAARRRGLI